MAVKRTWVYRVLTHNTKRFYYFVLAVGRETQGLPSM
jgi:hypothetical protein